MPIYEYQCRGCGSHFSKMRAMSNRLNAPDCPTCEGRSTSLAMSVPGHVGTATSGTPMDSCGMGESSCCGGSCLN